MGIPVDIVDAAGIEGGGSPLDAVNGLPLGKQEPRQGGAVLPRDAAYESNPIGHGFSLKASSAAGDQDADLSVTMHMEAIAY